MTHRHIADEPLATYQALILRGDLVTHGPPRDSMQEALRCRLAGNAAQPQHHDQRSTAPLKIVGAGQSWPVVRRPYGLIMTVWPGESAAHYPSFREGWGWARKVPTF
jgi:hypothetical protein